MSDRIDAALAALAAGEMVIVADDPDRENECDLVMPAAAMTTEHMSFFLRHGSGIVCVPLLDARADQLGLDPMVEVNTDLHRTAFTVSVDSAETGTGISASDRAATVRALGAQTTVPTDLRRPGHVFPVRARQGGVLRRAGHTEAATDLLQLAGLDPIAVITELVTNDGVPLSRTQVNALARRNQLPFVTIEELVRLRRRTEQLVMRTGDARLPTDFGVFHAWSYRSVLDGEEHLALAMGEPAHGGTSERGLLVRVHSECLTGDLFGSRRCDCGSQLRAALSMVADEGEGVILYLRGHEGRGIGLGHKLRAYSLQDRGRDTVDANLELGLPVDGREYGIGAAILADLGVRRIRLITNNPAKYSGLGGYDLDLVERVPVKSAVTADNIAYLRTKRDRMGHILDLPSAL
jgi:3,4-dihydroxy 2-butanone 4-phosphate synthase/GTP cyclohydrolase II